MKRYKTEYRAVPGDPIQFNLLISPAVGRGVYIMGKRILLCALLLIGALLLTCRSVAAQVKVWQDTLTLPTYEEGQPDENPPFDIYSTGRFNYPYTMRNNLTGVKAPHTWRAIELENKYLKCTILPDIGGHIYTCVDKISGQPIFYANPSIKKAQIGYRGAWAAFGVEFNFPVSHNWVSMSPVDFAYATHADGSGSVWVGNIDRVYGMQWQVELILRPESTVLEQRTTLYNRSDLRHRYYWWSNAGIQVWDDTRVEYPMRFVATHGFTDVYRWPVGPQGERDLSVIKNHTLGPVSYFAYGTREPFEAVWNPHTQTGTVHFSEFQELPSKKIWSWGVDPEGLQWRTALSDNESAYVEMQAGLFRNQETYAFLDPGQVIHFSEYWMPVRGTGGVSRANRTGVVRLDVSDSKALAALNVNEPMPGARISLLQNQSVLWSETADLTPEKTWSHSVTLKDTAEKITFRLQDKHAHTVLEQTDGKYDWDPETDIQTGPQEALRFPEAASRSGEDWLQLGRNQELNGATIGALATYREGLTHYPSNQSLTIAAGRLAVSLQQYEDGAHLLQTAQKRDSSNAEIAYYLGIAEEGLGRIRTAETAYEIAYRQATLRGPAALRLGELRAQQGELQDAASFLRAAVAAEPGAFRPREELEAVLRAQGKKDEADGLAKLGLEDEPTNDFLKQDTGKPDVSHLSTDYDRILRVSAEYIHLGLYRHALEVLTYKYLPFAADQSEPGSVLPQNNPLVLYYAAYCNKQIGADRPQNWLAASKLSTNLIFPSSDTDRVVLETAVSANTQDATAHFLLGTLLFSKAMTDAGLAQWMKARQLAPQLPVLDADIGKALLELKHNPQQAIAFFREGMRNDPANNVLYTGMEAAMSLTGVSAAERAEALAQYPSADDSHSKMPANLVYLLALNRAEAKQFQSALHLFQDRFFPSEEGGITSAQVQFEIRLLQASAWAAASDCTHASAFLQSAKPERGFSARDYVELAGIAQTCGQSKSSDEFLHNAAQSKEPEDAIWKISAERKLGLINSTMLNERLTEALSNAKNSAAARPDSSLRWYLLGLAQQTLHQNDLAKQSFEKALLLPDEHMSHHLVRQLMAAKN